MPKYGPIFDIAVEVLKPIAKRKFNLQYESAGEIDGPVLVLSNHNTDYDCYFVACAVDKRLSFVCTENVLRMGFLGWLATKFFDPIIHNKGTVGIATVRNILKKIKEGKSVAMFPEGNTSFNGISCPIPPATAKLAKTCGATLVTYRFRGGYFAHPRWGKGIRTGKLVGKVAGIYTPQQLAEFSEKELQERIEKDLYVDAYADQKEDPVAFKGKSRAEGLESVLFRCPDCGEIGTLTSSGDNLVCSCGFEAFFDEYGWINTKDGQRFTIAELDARQRQYIEELKTDGECFSDDADFAVVDEMHNKTKCVRQKIRAFKDRFCIGDMIIPFSDIRGIGINQRNLLLLHVAGLKGHYEISGPKSFSALKYLYLYRSVCGSQNGLI